MLEQWTPEFTRGYADAMAEMPAIQGLYPGDVGIIMCSTIPTEYTADDIEAYKAGVRYVMGDDVQFMLTRGSDR